MLRMLGLWLKGSAIGRISAGELESGTTGCRLRYEMQEKT